MKATFVRLLAVSTLAGACGHGSSAPEPAAAPAPAPAAAPGPRAVAPVSPADVRPSSRGAAPAAVPASAPAAPAAPAAAAAPSEPALYWRLGGQAAITMVVDTFTARVHGDTSLAPLFRGVDMNTFKRLLYELVCEAGGGPCHYSGRSMAAAHTGLAITNAQFDAVVGYMAATLDQFNVPAREKSELLGLLAPMRGDIVGH